MNRKSILLVLFFSFALSGCSLWHSPQGKTLTIKWSEPQKLHFQGKGAGAGIALMSTMGAMGMAIGVAIDEGIAKDISKTRAASGKTIEDIFNQANSDASLQLNWITSNITEQPALVIERIEFNIVTGKNDATGVKIKALYTDTTGKQAKLNYPNDYPDHKPKSFPLEELKSNNELANQLLLEGFEVILAAAKNQI